MKALPLEQLHLLELQELDFAIAKAKHQLKSHPLHETVAQLQGRAEDLRVATVAFEGDLATQNRHVRSIEDEIDKVKARRALQQDRLDQGKVPLRDMSALQHEINQIDVRIDTLETELIEAMGVSEETEAKIAAARQGQQSIADELATATASLGEVTADNARELEALQARRGELIDLIPEPVVKRYHNLQKHLGVGVVIEVKDGRPLASPVDLSMAELDELATYPKDQLYFTDDEYIVVRTSS